MPINAGITNRNAMVYDGGGTASGKKRKQDPYNNQSQEPLTGNHPQSASGSGGSPKAPTAPTYISNTMAYPTYSSPTAGAQYRYNTAAPTWEWDDSVRPGEYENHYQDQINSMVDAILNREQFSYDYNTDPLYKMYAEAYTRNGQQAMKDSYAQMAARTGGLGSSYAGTAAQSQYNQYMAALNDKVPELQQIAYRMYQDEGANMRNNLNMVQGLEATDYGRYQDLWNRYYNDRDFSYGRYSDDWNRWDTNRNWDYGLWQDNLARQEAAAQSAYKNQVAAYNARQQQVNAYNAAQQQAYNQALAAYQQYQNAPTFPVQNNSNGSISFHGQTFNDKDSLFGYIANQGWSASQIKNAVYDLLQNGVITRQEYDRLIRG